MQQVISPRDVITWSVLHGRGCNRDFSKWRLEILHEIEYLVFHNYFVFFGKKKFFFRNSRFPIRSVFVISVSLFTSVVYYCQNGLRRKHGKCSLCNEWWHSFMNQSLNRLVLLYKKCNCIRIMSLNTYNKNVDMIWHYCIISQIELHGFWKRSALTNMKKDALKYMINSLWYGIFHIICHINFRPILSLGPSALGLIWASRVDMTCDMKNAI